MRALLVLVVVACLAQTARADDVGVAVAGEPTMQKSVQAQLQSWLGKHHFTYVGDALDADTRTTLLNCIVIEDMACARATVEKRAKAPNLVFARVDLVGGDSRELAITGYWFVKDHEAVAEKRWCRKCDDAALARSVDELMTYLSNAGATRAPVIVVHEPPSRVVPTALLTVGTAALVTSGVFFTTATRAATTRRSSIRRDPQRRHLRDRRRCRGDHRRVLVDARPACDRAGRGDLEHIDDRRPRGVVLMRALALVLLAACGAKPNPAYCDHHPGDHQYCAFLDSGIESPPDTAALRIGDAPFAVCVPPPADPITLSGDFDSDLSTSCATVQPPTWKAANESDACFVVATTIMVSDVVAHGGRPLVLIASDTITVTGLDVSSRNAATTFGAGFDASACAAFASTPVVSTGGSGGGAGGTLYGATGGAGGPGQNSSVMAGTPAPAIAMATALRGGCPGQDGAIGTTVDGPGGPGGGAMYLAAVNEIDLTSATLQASGAGGSGGTHVGGGGGGGSGGMIILHSAVIGASGATIMANGGGGGAGGATSTGNMGSDPSNTQATSPAAGGATGGGGGAGGNGFAGSNTAQPGLTNSYSGGGGGGGGGYIQSNHVLSTQSVSPTPVTL